MEKKYYTGTSQIVNKLHTGTTGYVTSVFMKKAKILSEAKHVKIVVFFFEFMKNGSIMMETCEFDFELFNSDKKGSTSDQFLSYTNQEDVFDSFPGIDTVIATDVV